MLNKESENDFWLLLTQLQLNNHWFERKKKFASPLLMPWLPLQIESVNNSLINASRETLPDIWKPLDKISHRKLLHKLSSDGTSANIKPLLSDRSVKLVVNVQSSEVHKISSNAHRAYPIGTTFFLLYINDHSKNILRSLVNIYSDETTACGCTARSIVDQNLATNVSSNLALTAERVKIGL